jgi:hypothetical protein
MSFFSSQYSRPSRTKYRTGDMASILGRHWCYWDGLGSIFCQARPQQRHFQQDRSILRRLHHAGQFYALGREMLIGVAPIHWIAVPSELLPLKIETSSL